MTLLLPDKWNLICIKVEAQDANTELEVVLL